MGASDMMVELVDWRSLDRETMTACMQLHTKVWPSPEPLATVIERTWQDAQQVDSPQVAQMCGHLIRDGQRIIALARSFHRIIAIDGISMPILALAGVCVDTSSRGRGYGEAVVRHVWSRLDDQVRCSLFQTGIANFYERMGAVRIHNRITSSGRSFWDPHALIYPAKTVWPAGTIDLQGDGW
jgi:ribosomal protein S18 acetylase RimI-like enzyme